MLYKTHILPIDYFHRLVARENARFQNYASRLTGTMDLARRRRADVQKLRQFKGFGAVSALMDQALAFDAISAARPPQPHGKASKINQIIRKMRQTTATTTTTTTTTRKTAAAAPILIHLPTPDHPPLAAILVLLLASSNNNYYY